MPEVVIEQYFNLYYMVSFISILPMNLTTEILISRIIYFVKLSNKDHLSMIFIVIE